MTTLFALYEATPIPQPPLATSRAWDVTGGTAPYVVRCGVRRVYDPVQQVWSEEADEWTCSCPHFFFRVGSRGRKPCKHIEFVRTQEKQS